jgi:DNA-directed RNA polymerase subunit H (RpoH/RPB5)
MEIVIAMTKKMLERRQYTHIEFTENDKYGKKPRFIASKKDDEVTVFFIEHNKVSSQVIKSIISTTKTKHIIIIYAFSLTPDAKQSINTESPFQFEIFSFDEMSYDPIEIVPPHKKIDNKPAEWNKFPIILTSDIIARYYWFKHGDVIAIDENNYTSYRKCIKLST